MSPDWETSNRPDNMNFNVNFNARLDQLVGDYILFASEEVIRSSWCGSPGQPCQSCLTDAAEDNANACADRLVNSDLAASLTRLAKFVEAEWGNSMLSFISCTPHV